MPGDDPDELPTTQSGAIKETLKIARRLNKTITSFDDITTVGRQSILEINSDFPLSKERSIFPDELVTHDATESEYELTTADESGSTAFLETVDIIRVVGGYAFEGGFSIRVPEMPTGEQDFRVGIWEPGESGSYLGLDADGPYIETIRNGNRTGKIRPEDWNGEGTNEDITTLLKTSTVVRIKPYLYNSGTVDIEMFERNDEGRYVSRTLHRWSNEEQTTWARQANPIRIEAANNATAEPFTAYVQDRQAARRGDFGATDRTKGDRRQDISVSDGWVPILSVRQKEGFGGVPINLKKMTLSADDAVIIQVRSDAITDADAVSWEPPQNVDEDETATEWVRTPHGGEFDINAGAWRFQDLIEGTDGRGNSSISISDLPDVDAGLRRNRPLTIAARSVDGTATDVNVALVSVLEGW